VLTYVAVTLETVVVLVGVA